jgi:hypothetical protein
LVVRDGLKPRVAPLDLNDVAQNSMTRAADFKPIQRLAAQNAPYGRFEINLQMPAVRETLTTDNSGLERSERPI